MNMKWAVGLAVAALVLGTWAGVRARQSGVDVARVELGLAILFGAIVIFALWAWSRAPAGSGDALAMPVLVLFSAAMLIGLLPRVLWPEAQAVHIGASVVSLLVLAGALTAQFRRRRRRRQGGRPA